MSGIRAVDLGTFLASSESAARSRSPMDPGAQRTQTEQAAAYLDIRHELARKRVEEKQAADRVLPRKEREEGQQEDARDHEEHPAYGRDGRIHGDDDGHPHVDLAV